MGRALSLAIVSDSGLAGARRATKTAPLDRGERDDGDERADRPRRPGLAGGGDDGKAGLEKRFHVHELRHYAATALDEHGLAGKLRTEVIGHANEDITNRIYTHVRRERAAVGDFDPLR